MGTINAGGTDEDMLGRCFVAQRNIRRVSKVLKQASHPSGHEMAAVREVFFEDILIEWTNDGHGRLDGASTSLVRQIICKKQIPPSRTLKFYTLQILI
jgi:hypothetical protein